ncbi:hypothetical protein JS530_03045 [Bifidobacterium sp. LC6]|uniref:Ig-like domain-containing protein n=1 Tax=Bifidobacterium colobi TaxID=2809026 RepID=A0ABS5UU13_9BIFI|nr:hypothetical protein [Bifidobacterium colobi]MBT1174494.1 hypothetical protein [Bifidobacterium colobi]
MKSNTRTWLKPLFGSVVAVAALTFGAVSIAPLAVADNLPKNDSDTAQTQDADHPTSLRTFPPVKETAKSTDQNTTDGKTDSAETKVAGDTANAEAQSDAAAAAPAAVAATAPTMKIEAYAAKNGVVPNDAKPLGSATNASSIRLGITVTNYTDFPAGAFDKTTGKYVGDAKDQSAIALDIQPLGGRFNVRYGDFRQVLDKDGKPVEGSYEVKPQDGPAFALNGASGTNFTVAVDTPTYDASKGETPVALDKFVAQDGSSTITKPTLTHDTTAPAAPTAAAFGAGWTAGTVNGKKVQLSDGNAALNVTFAANVETGAKVQLVSADGKTVGDLTASGKTATWTPNADTVANVADLNVVVTDAAGNKTPTKLSTLLGTANAVDTLVVDTAKNYKVAVTGEPNAGVDVNGVKYYTKVSGLSITGGNQTTLPYRLALTDPLVKVTAPAGATAPTGTATVENNGTVAYKFDSTLSGDGQYTAALQLQNNASATFALDSTAPAVTKVAYAGNGDELTSGSSTILLGSNNANASATLTFTVDEQGSGFDVNDVKLDTTGAFTGTDGKAADPKPQITANGNTVTATFTQAGTYDFSKMKIQVNDKVGNQGANTAVTGVTDGGTLPKELVIADMAKLAKASSTFTVTPAQGKDAVNVNGAKWYGAAPTVEVTIKNNYLAEKIAAVLAADKNTKVFSQNFNGTDNAATVTYQDLTVKATGDSATVTFPAAFQPKDDGWYQYTANNDASYFTALFGKFAPAVNAFGVDTGKPEVESVTLNGTAISANTEYNGKKIFAAVGPQTLTVTVKDYRTGANPQSTDHTSGVQKVSAKVKKAKDLVSAAEDVNVTIAQQSNQNGTYVGTVTLPEDGYYDLSDVEIQATDNVGNDSGTVTANSKTGDVDAVVAIAKGAKPSVSAIQLDDISGKKEGNHAGYYRGDVKATYTVTDKWFPLTQNATAKYPDGTSIKDADLLASSKVDGTQNGFMQLEPSDTDWKNSNGYNWTISKNVRKRGETAVQEGTYEVKLQYKGFYDNPSDAAKPEAGKLINGRDDFIIDWTKPTLGQIALNPDQKVWKQLLFAESETVTLNGIGDNLAGIDDASKAFATTTQGDDDKAGSNDVDNDHAVSFDTHNSGVKLTNADLSNPSAGSMSFTMNADSFRLNADGTSLAVCDMAGNCASTGDFSNLSAFKDKIEKIVIDNVAPTLAVTYDNNDVRNGKYYKAHRTGTVTIVESNLDLIQERDGDRVVVTTDVDGTKQTVKLKDFKALAKDDGKTYTAQFKADKDGDWTVDASFADVLHPAVTYHTEFTVDTIAPKLTLTFDNNNAKNGMYYAADRHATVKEVERNFSESESVITVTAKDDNGADITAPSPAGWSRTGGERESTEWTNTVAFTTEAHFTIKANATDLAGNVAEEVSEPEFVIDKTKPQVKIERVENKTAYAGTVAPLIDYDDTNIDMSHVNYTITGSHRGELKDKEIPLNTTTNTDNTRTVDFKDFERKVQLDDVYTIKATATDMAGNAFETQKTFSVNRFGSTYLFDAGTTSLRGTYLKKAENVVITEINVSGLKPDARQIVVAKDDKANTLNAGKDFTTKTNDDKGWSSTTYTVPASNFNADGFYRVQVQSVDEAGNLSQNTMNNKDASRKNNAEVNFAIDTTAPTASLLGLRSGSVYYSQSGHSVSVDAKDNMGIKSTEVYVDGQPKGSWKGDALLKSTPSLNLDADATSHEIVIHTIDQAGNEATSTYDNIYVASNWWQYATHTAWIRNMMIFALLLVLAAIAGIIVWVAQRKKQFAYRKNPFERE